MESFHVIGKSGLVLFSASALVCRFLLHCNLERRVRDEGRNNTPKTDFDVIIVGSGPAGSTSAYFLAKKGLKIAVYDKKKFPRHKPCGDAWCSPALDILSEMGVLKTMEEDKIIKVVQRGGFISPYGYKCVNTEGATYGTVTGCKTYAIKRYIADDYLVRSAAANDSVTLFEETEVLAADFIVVTTSELGYWKVTVGAGGATTTKEVTARMLLICDGSTSYLGQKLGIVPKGSQPEAVCSHAYVKRGTHNWHEADGVMIFNHAVLPGYSALFRHYNDDMYLGTYILPGGKATSRAIAPFEAEAIEAHPYIRDAFGEKYDWEVSLLV
jgi:flavin-dependent dehydrogenase